MKATPRRTHNMAVNAETIKTNIGECPFRNGKANILPLVEKVNADGFAPYLSTSPVEPIGRSLFLANPNGYKVDLYTLTVPIVKQVLDTAVFAIPQHPPFGLVKNGGVDEKNVHIYKPLDSFKTSRPFREFEEALATTLNRALDLDYNGNEEVRAENPKLKSVYSGYDDLAYLKEITPDYLIARGIGTASRAITKTLEVLPKVFTTEFPDIVTSGDHLMQLAENSYPLVAFLAGKHKRITLPILDALEKGNRNGPFNPENFTIKNNRLVFSQKGKELVKKIIRDHKQVEPEIGCPGLYSDAIKTLWTWNIHIAREIYSTYPIEVLTGIEH